MKRWLFMTAIVLVLLATGPTALWLSGEVNLQGHWRSADRSSAGLAPDPQRTREAVVQVYSARAFDWRGLFAVHTWIATKPQDAAGYTVHQVTGWRRPTLSSRPGTPDRAWFGSTPSVHATLCGPPAAAAIGRIESLLPDYPYRDVYRTWPGPNSNTFVAWLVRQVPELDVALPATAIGKDYLGRELVAIPPGGSGLQLSLGGVLGATLGAAEGLEVNIAGLVIGIDPLAPELKLPGLGSIAIPGLARGTQPAHC
ncbi:DUF3750 domain-containing protein [Billgrantia gudaonensis]|uniref:DUF3750 domain-containing protein n=1 Tax=Billgrantia gudaonensis TaxID=376427 RepID=A0A1G8VDW4_9GAMM|nr:DUF3750 domain-containing protein [Halomonas gudaonensis]SDJ64104.1 Protein of unknown function [Halomonas gudaonensis]